MPYKNGVTGYVQPNDAGLNSTPDAVGRRIAKLLNSLADEINSWIVGGPIEQDTYAFRMALIAKLEADGWIVKINARDRFTCKPGPKYWASVREKVSA